MKHLTRSYPEPVREGNYIFDSPSFQPAQWRYDRTSPRLVSLIEMLEHQANHFYWANYHMRHFQLIVEQDIRERGADALPNQSEATTAKRILKRLINCCDPVEFDRALTRISTAFNLNERDLQPIAGLGAPFTLGELSFQLKELTREVSEVLGQNKFIMIPANDAHFYDNLMLFGDDVARKFPKANAEITVAGTCYAVGCYSACVFHLMRAIELGARSVVIKLKVQKHLMKNSKPIPIELCDWNALVDALQKGLNDLSQGTATSKRKKETFEFYNHVLGAFRNFKDAWRNNVSHMRKVYQPGETIDLLRNTRQFMQHLATKLKEG